MESTTVPLLYRRGRSVGGGPPSPDEVPSARASIPSDHVSRTRGHSLSADLVVNLGPLWDRPDREFIPHCHSKGPNPTSVVSPP